MKRSALTKRKPIAPASKQDGPTGPSGGPRGFNPKARFSGEVIGAAGGLLTNRYGYGSYGASRRKVGLEEWHAHSGDPDVDITANLPLLRQRSRDLFMGAPIARAAILTLRTNTVGNGLWAMPGIDGDVLGKSNEECAALNKLLSEEFDLWGDKVECDFNRRSSFYQLQDLVFVSQCISGDVLVLLDWLERPGSIYGTKLRLIEADRVSSPWVIPGVTQDRINNGAARIFGGVELSDEGEVEAYWIARRHPGAALVGSLFNGSPLTADDYDRVPAYGAETGRPNALLVGEMERPEQRRAVPMMAGCLTELKNLSRYVESTTVQNVIKSYFTSFITSAMPSTEMFSGIVGDDALTDFWQRDPYHVKLGPGVVNWMRPGDSITFPINAGPESEFEPYTTALVKYIGACLGIPFEVLLKQFNASYSASRASLLQFWGRVKVLRQLLVDQFCQPVYEAWLMEAVRRGRVKAPGFNEDPRIFRAWSKCSWSGAGQGSIDPLKEVMAADRRIKAGISTLERECLEINGSDWRANTVQQGLELQLSIENGLPYTRNQTAEDSPIPPELLVNEGEPLPPEDEELFGK